MFLGTEQQGDKTESPKRVRVPGPEEEEEEEEGAAVSSAAFRGGRTEGEGSEARGSRHASPRFFVFLVRFQR